MAYLFLILTIISDVLGTACLKLSNGFTVVIPSIGVIIFYTMVYFSFSHAIKALDLGYAYATWSACGVALMAITGIMFFNEPITLIKLISLILVIIGVVGLQIA